MHQDLRVKPIPNVLRTPRTDPVYNCHAYLTKVPLAAATPFVEHFTRAGETVLDPFAGSGMIGIAAAILGRRAHLSDISILGQHIATGYLTETSPSDLRKAAADVVAAASDAIGDLYATRRQSDGKGAHMTRTVWSFTYICPACATPMVYFRHLRKGGTAQPDSCPACGEGFVRRAWPRGGDVPVQVVVKDHNGRLVDQEPAEIDLKAIKRASDDPRQSLVPSLQIGPDREMFRRSALAKHGLTDTKTFFSRRNSLALLELRNAIGQVPTTALRTKLLFAFTAILTRASRRYQWGPKRPLNAQNQTYYVAPVYYEWNVFDLFLRKVEAAIRADDAVFRSHPLFSGDIASRVSYHIASADHLDYAPDESVDYVFTDPPFGSNMFYSDMSLFHEAWLGSNTDHAREAVIHTTRTMKDAAAERYEALLRSAFREAQRALKPGRFMSVVFGNSNGRIWSLVQRAIREAGFDPVPAHVAILDKGQRSVKGLNSGSEGVVTVDLVLTVRKPESPATPESSSSLRLAEAPALIEGAVRTLDVEGARNPSYIYAATVREAIRRHELVDNLHLADVLIALRNAGYTLDARTGLLDRPVSPRRYQVARKTTVSDEAGQSSRSVRAGGPRK